MNRHTATTIRLVDIEKLTSAQRSQIATLVLEGKIEFVQPHGIGYVRPGVAQPALLRTGAFEVIANFPTLYELVGPSDSINAIWKLDNSGTYKRITSTEELNAGVLANQMAALPTSLVDVTEEFLNTLTTLTKVKTWITGRHLDAEIDMDLSKEGLVTAIKAYYDLGLEGHPGATL